MDPRDKQRRALVADFLAGLSDIGAMDHLDAYGGARLAVDVDEVFAKLEQDGWQIKKETDG